MTTITISYQLPDDMEAFEKAHHAIYAWGAISDALSLIRNHLKHDHLTADQAIQAVRSILIEAEGVIQQ